MDRTILHCDCNSFYASVETILDPRLGRGPMAVCGDPTSRHGVILAKNEAAKKYGIQTAETVWKALQKCPELTLCAPHREAYVRVSHDLNEIYQQYTDLVDPFGIDESFLDVTGSMHLFGTGPEIADELRARVKKEIGLTISVGVSWNRAFAKLGSDYKKPDATTVFTRENYRELVCPLPASALLYVGRHVEERLHALGIHTIGELAACDPALLRQVLGKAGETVSRYARGEDSEPVRSFYEEHAVKSVGKGCTFSHDLRDPEELRLQIMALCDNVGMRVRRQGVKYQTVQVLIRDPQFRNISRQETLETPTDSTRILTEEVLRLLRRHWKPGKPIRMLTVTASGLTDGAEAAEQLSLFDEGASERRRRKETLDHTMDALRGRFGREAVQFGRALTAPRNEASADEEED